MNTQTQCARMFCKLCVVLFWFVLTPSGSLCEERAGLRSSSYLKLGAPFIFAELLPFGSKLPNDVGHSCLCAFAMSDWCSF